MTTSVQTPDIPPNDASSQLDEQPQLAPKTTAASQPSNALTMSELDLDHQIAVPEVILVGRVENTAVNAKARLSNLLKDKEQEWTAVVDRNGPLQLLDLPMDVLKEIVKEVTHTNDLTALALAHSALHNLAIPHIYSRFDIVWPDAHATTEPRTGVDALTYGLATLCMGNSPSDYPRGQKFDCQKCHAPNIVQCNHGLDTRPRNGQRRLGNRYPQFIRKFSIGNGPTDWVQEYLITKESGKMLGTLVALAIAKMSNLETFMWDMPTGVLRDVWLALSSLQDCQSSQDCRLERVWVRWHDNSEASHTTPAAIAATTITPQMLAGSTMTSIGWTLPSASVPATPNQPRAISYAQCRVEYPTLSVLPPLKSLSVLDIDELDYLDEMSILIASSKDCLRELRVGISAKAANRDFAHAWDAPELYQVDHSAQWPGASTILDRRLGGVLGILLGRVHDLRRKSKVPAQSEISGTFEAPPAPTSTTTQQTEIVEIVQNNLDDPEVSHPASIHVSGNVVVTTNLMFKETSIFNGPANLPSEFVDPSAISHIGDALETSFVPHVDPLTSIQSDVESLTTLISAQNKGEIGITSYGTVADLERGGVTANSERRAKSTKFCLPERERLDGRLRLQNLELERVHLSVAVLQRAFDWTVLSSLTLLDCSQHEKFWSMLRRYFQPSAQHESRSKHGSSSYSQYQLNIRKIHTDAASPALIAFLKETLAPNTLETLFLQDRRRGGTPSVTIDAIYRGPLKRHRSSLKKLMLDSSDSIPQGPAHDAENTRWRTWMPSRDVLNFITSGRMSSLRELSIAIDYRDWHHFLQRLPQIPHVRSLNIPFIADHVTPEYDPHDLAMQVVDVIVLRPEVELCYMAVSHKCFEILENHRHDDVHSTSHNPTGGNGSASVFTDDEEEDEEANAISGPDHSGINSTQATNTGAAEADADSDASYDEDGDTDSFWDSDDDQARSARLRLREILFYDDKVALFKARHGKL